VGFDVGFDAGVAGVVLPPQLESKKLTNRAAPGRKMIRDTVFKGPFWIWSEVCRPRMHRGRPDIICAKFLDRYSKTICRVLDREF